MSNTLLTLALSKNDRLAFLLQNLMRLVDYKRHYKLIKTVNS